VALTTLVCYDIVGDQARARVAAALQQWGDRLQKSVFLCTLTHEEQAELIERIREMIDTATDSVYFVDLCGTCWNSVEVLGQATVTPPPLYWAVL
jgi:CRISPR-associated protein Cas2